LQKYKTEIAQLLQSEIVRRYYFESGRLENSLTEDPAIVKALAIFADKAAYKKILGK
jgi:carboxyl-terminal processing protease